MLYKFCAHLVLLFLVVISRYRRIGRQRVPKDGPFIVTCSHAFALDSLYLGVAMLPQPVHFMAKQELLALPVLGGLLRRLHVYPVNRKNPGPGVVKHTLKVLKSGGIVGIFPEGTRAGGAGQLKSGAVRLALRARVPIVPAWYEGPKSWREVLRRPRATIAFGEPLSLAPYHDLAVTDELVAQLVAEMGAAMQRCRQEIAAHSP